VRAATDEQLWVESYDRKLEDVLALQNEVARTIVAKIRVRTTLQERARLAGGRAIDPAAHEAYLKGRFYWNKGRTPENMTKTVEYFNEAIQKDQGYAAAYSGLADFYSALATWGMLLPRDAFPSALKAARKALQLDPDLAEAHASLARIRALFDWDWRGAESEYKRAIELNPGYSLAHLWYGHLLVATGRPSEGVAESERAVVNNGASWVYYDVGRYDRSIEQSKRMIEIDPMFTESYQIIAHALEAKGASRAAFDTYQKYAEVAGYSQEAIAALKRAYDSAGMKGYWTKRLEMEKEEEAETGHAWSFEMARLYARVGDRDRAFEWLERAYLERHHLLIFIKADPILDGLDGDPRFADLVRRIGLPG
jgi:tetratricopeptide (TPR) repeat protein